MRILFLSQLIPYPLDAGPKVRIYHVLQYLAAAGHDVTLVAFRRDSDSAKDIRQVGSLVRELHTVLMVRSPLKDALSGVRSLLTGRPFLIDRDRVGAVNRLIDELLAGREFDAIHADQLWMAQYALRASTRAGQTGKRPMRVLDQHNAVYMIPKRMADGTAGRLKRAMLRLESQKLAQYELDTCSNFNRVVWVTQEDREAVRAMQSHPASVSPSRNGQQDSGSYVIPICVDPDSKPAIERMPSGRRVTFLGGLHWPPNAEGVTWFVREVWPLVLRRSPDAILTLIGKDPPQELVEMSRTSISLEVIGYVEDPEPYLKETAAFIVPLLAGGGMRVKIVDAWSWALPVVSTTIGAEGTGYEDGIDLLIADTPIAFAEAVARLLNDPEAAKVLGAAGRQTVLTGYDWRKVYRAWDKIYSAKPHHVTHFPDTSVWNHTPEPHRP